MKIKFFALAILFMAATFDMNAQLVDKELVNQVNYEYTQANGTNLSGMAKGDKYSRSSFYYGRLQGEELDFNFSLGWDFIGGQYVMDNVSLQAGLGLTISGYGYKYGRTNYDFSETIISVPIALGYSMPIGEKSSLDLYTGPRLNYIISGKSEVKENGKTIEKKKYKDIKNIERFHVNWNVGAALCFGTWGITAEYRPALNNDFADFFHIGIVFK